MVDERRDDDLNMDNEPDANRDPITGEPGSHPVGTGVGAAGGASAGAVAGGVVGGAVGGPIGAGVGAGIGAVAGGLAGGVAGKGVAEAINPTVEEAYWRDNYSGRPYYESDYTYDEDYLPAYRYGWESRGRYADRRYDDIEGDLESGWGEARSESRLSWNKAKHATRDAWHRVERTIPGDADNDGR